MPSTDYSFELIHTTYLYGLIALAWVVGVAAVSLTQLGRTRSLASTFTRATSIALLVAALAELSLVVPAHDAFVVIAVDESQSIDAEAGGQANEFIEQARKQQGGNRLEVGKFNGQSGSLATNLEEAIRRATAKIPAGYAPHVVLLTDGQETEGDAFQAALTCEVPISTVPLERHTSDEVQLTSLTAPAEVRSGEPFNVEVILDSTREGEGVIELYENDHLIVSETQKVTEGQTHYRFRHSLNGGQVCITAVVRDFPDTQLNNNKAETFVFTLGEPNVLLIQTEPERANHLRWALEEEGLAVQVRPTIGLPESLAELESFDLIMLADVPALELSDQQVKALRQYVELLGGGLVVIGGEQSFGLGGYYGSALEELLPLRSDFERDEEKPSMAMVLAIDRSGSMTGEKIELAKDAAKGAVELLGVNDSVGVLAFEGDAFWVSEIHPCTDKNYILERISRITAGGGTELYQALNEVFLALGASNANLKHCIVLSDGNSPPGDYDSLVSAMNAARITVSTVAVGEEADRELLQRIAETGQGRYYFCEDASSVPQVFARETIAASRSALHEEPFLPVLMRPTRVLDDIEIETAPFLLGYVGTRPKPTSELILATESGEPLLAWWRLGLGTVAAFTSDASSRWAAEWLDWPGYSRFWAQLARHAMRSQETRDAELALESDQGQAKIILDVVDERGEFINQADTEVDVIGATGQVETIELTQTAPGRYETVVETSPEKTTQLQVRQALYGRPRYRASRAVAASYPEELRVQPPNLTLLKQIASASGGRFDPSPKEIILPLGTPGLRMTPLWPWLLVLAAAFNVLDVAFRRIGMGSVGTQKSEAKL